MPFKTFVVSSLAGLILVGAGCNIVTVRSTAPTVSTVKTSVRPVVTITPSSTAMSPQLTVPAVEDYLTDHLVKTKANGRLFASFYTYAQEERDEELYYYIWAVVREYVKRGSTVERVGGSSLPLNVVLTKDGEGAYSRVLGYRQARSENASAAVRELYPAAAANLVINAPEDHARRVDLLEREVLAKAQSFFAQGEPVSIPDIEKQKCTTFKFEDYLDLTPYTGTPGALRIPAYLKSNQKAAQAIANSYGSGLAFAGHYSLAKWSCGVNCYDYVVVDSLGGGVVGAPFRARYGVEFRSESRMLIVNPYRNILAPNIKVTTSYLLLKDGPNPTLISLCSYTPPNTPPDPALSGVDSGPSSIRRYLSENPSECAVMAAQCNTGEIFFTDGTGCGCESGSAN